MKKLIILLLLLPFALSTCKDKEPQYLGEFKLGPDGEAYIKFEPGSYWIYQNSKSLKKDTIVMQWYNSKMLYFEGDVNTFYDEDLDIRLTSTYGTYQVYSVHPYADATPHDALLESLKYHSLPVTKLSSGTTLMFYYPMDKSETRAVSGQKTEFIKQHDSLQVQGKWYYTVAEFEVDNDWMYSTKETNHTKYYWAKNVGLIRRVLLEERTISELESWDIIEYNVTQ